MCLEAYPAVRLPYNNYYILFFDCVKAGLFAAVDAHRFYMDSADGNNMSAVFCVEVVKVRSVLEVVCENIAAVNNLIGLYIVGKLNDFEGDVFLGKDVLRYLEDFCVRSGRSRNGNCLSFKSLVVNGGVKAVAGVFDNTYNSAFIFACDEVCDLLAFKGGEKCFCFVGIFIALFYAENVAVCGGRAFHCKRLAYGVNTRVNGVVGVDYRIVNVLKNVRKLSRFGLFELDVVGVLNNISYGCGDACILFEGDKSLFLKKEQCAGFVSGVAGNCNGDFAAAAAAGAGSSFFGSSF